MTVPRVESTSILHDLDFDTIDLDEHYVISELENLEEKAKDNFAIEATKYDFNIPSFSKVDIKNIVTHLEKIKNDLRNRVQEAL